MQRLPLLLFLSLVRATQGADTNPVARVIALLDSLAAKITAEGEAEEKAFQEYTDWCTEVNRNKGFEIKTLTSNKAKLEAEIDKKTGEAEASSSKIEQLSGSIATGEKDLSDATTIRKKEAADFAATEAELADIIDTVGRAVSVLEREMAKNPAAFAQVDTKNMEGVIHSLGALVDAAAFPAADKQKLLTLVQAQQNSNNDDEDADLGAPAASIYKTHSGGILDVLEDMKEKAEEQLASLRKAEVNAKHNFGMLKQSLEDQLKFDNKDKDDETAAKTASLEAKAVAEGDLAMTEKGLADAKAALESAKQNCAEVAEDHGATVAGRKEELKAIADGKKVLMGTSAGAVKQTYSFLQMNGVSQLHSRVDLANTEVINIVKKLAKKQHSAALAQLASRIAAVIRMGAASGEDPFVKVKGLISDLITRLEEEAKADATEKAYCDEQLAKTEEKKAELEHDMGKLTTKIDIATSKSATLKEELAVLESELAELAKLQAQMDKIRQESNADYKQAKADLELGLKGVREALSILREYYGSSSASMIQSSMGDIMSQPARPDLHGAAGGAGSSIIGILEVIESDFAKNLAEEETQEEDAQSEYDKQTQINAVTKTLKDQDVKYKTQEMQSLAKSLAELTADKETTSAELSAVMEYYSKIKSRCIAKPETYEERARRRAEEIAGLKEALSILETETAFVQRGKKGLRGHFIGM